MLDGTDAAGAGGFALGLFDAADASADQAEQAVAMLEQIANIVDANKDSCDAMGEKLDGDEGAARIKLRQDDTYVPPEFP